MEAQFGGHPVRLGPGGVLRVLIIARISTDHQDSRSLDDQAALCRTNVSGRYDGPVSFRVIAGRGSGELLDRRDLRDAEDAVLSGEIDLVVVEDLGRISRRQQVVSFIELCLDEGARLVAINDSLDTASDGWRMNALFSSLKHESSNAETAKRIRRSLRNRFTQGSIIQSFQYGYVKPPGAKSDADVSRDPAADRIYKHWFAMLKDGARSAEVARWLNSQGVPPGPSCRRKTWDGPMVTRLTRNPILKGVRRRNVMVASRIHKTGRRITIRARMEDRLERHVPHLAFIEPTLYDEVIAALNERGAAMARGHAASTRTLRKPSTWPGRHVVCGVCGHPYHWGANGVTDSLICSGAKDHACWNGAAFKGLLAAQRIVAAVCEFAESTPRYDEAFLARVEAASRARDGDRAEREARLAREAEQADRELANLVDAVAAMGFSTGLRNRLMKAEATVSRVASERAALAREAAQVPPLPPVDELRRLAREALGAADFSDPAFGRLMARLVPRAVAFPYRLPDGGRMVLRADLTLNLVPLLGPAGLGRDGLLTREVTIDLFDPPHRAADRDRILALRAGGATQRAIAAEIGVKQPCVQRAILLDRATREAGRSDPFVWLAEPPPVGPRLRRRGHSEYAFRPLEGFPATPRKEVSN